VSGVPRHRWDCVLLAEIHVSLPAPWLLPLGCVIPVCFRGAGTAESSWVGWSLSSPGCTLCPRPGCKIREMGFRVVFSLHFVACRVPQSCLLGGFCSSGGICGGNVAFIKDLRSVKQRTSFHSTRRLSPPLLNLLAQPVGTVAAETEMPKGRAENAGAALAARPGA